MGPGFFDAMAGIIALGALAAWGLPKLWEILKPWVHAITA